MLKRTDDDRKRESDWLHRLVATFSIPIDEMEIIKIQIEEKDLIKLLKDNPSLEIEKDFLYLNE